MANDGTLTEQIVDRTISHYLCNGMALIRRAFPGRTAGGNFISRADLDYYGVYRGRYISFEVKSTEGDVFNLSQIRSHQRDSLNALREHGAISFLLIHFIPRDSFWVLPTDRLGDVGSRIAESDMHMVALGVNLIFPGILDLLPAVDTHFFG